MDSKIKLIVVGDCGVGKTSLLIRYVENVSLRDEFIPTLTCASLKIVRVDGKVVTFDLLDTAG